MQQAGDVVQLVRTLPCHGRGRGFESRRPRHILKHLVNYWTNGHVPECSIRAVVAKDQVQNPGLRFALSRWDGLSIVLQSHLLRVAQQFRLRRNVLPIGPEHG